MRTTYALIKDGIVEALVNWDTENRDISEVTDLLAVETEDCQVGDQYIDGKFIAAKIEE